VSVEDFTRAQLLRRTRGAGGMAGIAKLERSGSTPPKRTYLLRGRVRCAVCERKMQGGVIRTHAYYRCLARSLAPGSPVLDGHPRTVNVREDVITGAINGWIGQLFAPENRDETVRTLVESQGDPAVLAVEDAARRRLADAETALKRYQAAIAAGVEPAAVVDAINQARAERDAARAHPAQTPAGPDILDVAEVYAMVDALGDVGSVIERAQPERLARLYRELDLDIRYRPVDDGGEATLSLRVANECVRGGSCALTTRLALL
jgi:hypothetical protein